MHNNKLMILNVNLDSHHNSRILLYDITNYIFKDKQSPSFILLQKSLI